MNEQRRDERLRRSILEALKLAQDHAPTGRLSGPTLRDQAEVGMPTDGGFEGDSHALRLARELDRMGLAKESIGTLRRGEAFGLSHVSYGLTASGLALLLEQIAPVKGVWDERVTLGE